MSGWFVFIAWISLLVTSIFKGMSGWIHDQNLKYRTTKRQRKEIQKSTKKNHPLPVYLFIRSFRLDTLKYAKPYYRFQVLFYDFLIIIQFVIAVWTTIEIFRIGHVPMTDDDPWGYCRETWNGRFVQGSLYTTGIIVVINQIRTIARRVFEKITKQSPDW